MTETIIPHILTQFNLFPKLPLELRLLIWTLTLPGPRQVVPRPSRHSSNFYYHFHDPTNFHDFDLVALHVSQESRSVALRYYSTWLNAASFGYQYMDFSLDSIYFNNMELNGNPGSHLLLNFSRRDFARIRRLDIGFNDSGDRFAMTLCVWMDKWLVHLFSKVEEFNALLEVRNTQPNRIFRRFGPQSPPSMDGLKTRIDKAKVAGVEKLEEIAKKKAKGGNKWSPPLLNIRVEEL